VKDFAKLIERHPLPWKQESNPVFDRILDKNHKLVCVINQDGYDFGGPPGVLKGIIELANSTMTIPSTTKPVLNTIPPRV
jgi:hypothetical protein